jgi:hypothetical protein
MSDLSVLGVASLVFSTVVAALMFCAQVGPAQAKSNLALWAGQCGIHTVPSWLRSRAADRFVIKWGKYALGFSMLIGIGGLTMSNFSYPTIGMVVSGLGFVACAGWYALQNSSPLPPEPPTPPTVITSITPSGVPALPPVASNATPPAPAPQPTPGLDPSRPTPVPYYSKEERKEIINVFRALRAFLKERKEQPNAGIRAMTQFDGRWGSRRFPPTDQIPQIAEDLSKYPAEILQQQRILNEILAKADFAKAVIYPAIAVDDIEGIFSNFRAAVFLLAERLKKINSWEFADKQIDQFDQAWGAYQNWLSNSIQRVEATTEDVRRWP